MRFHISTVVKNLQGKDFKDRDENNKEIPLTLGGAALTGLLGALPQDQGLPGNLKMLHWEIAKKIKAAQFAKVDFMDLSADHIALVKNRILMAFETHVAGPICDAIEGGAEEGKLKAAD